jgi:non-heme chloroperoxidase
MNSTQGHAVSTAIGVDVGRSVPRIRTVSGGGGLQLHVREWGRVVGPSVLLLHGWSGNHMCWRGQVDSELADEFRLVAVDLRGHGMSGRPLDSAPYQDRVLWAADVAAVIDVLELDRPTLVGWSYGGFVIADYVREYGADDISAINLVGGAVTLNERFDHIGPAFLAAAPGGAHDDMPTKIGALRRFWRSMTDEPMAEVDLETGLCGSMVVPPQILGALISRQIDSDDVLAGLTLPVLVSHGRRDQIVLPSMAEHVLHVCPTAEPSWYEATGHMPFLEDPTRFNRELAELARLPTTTGTRR